MASSIDEVLEQIGTMGRFQIRLMALLSFLRFKGGLQAFLMTFITAEPAWHCVANSSVCNITGVFHPGQKNYEYRCDKKIPRNEWRFEDSYTSTATEVKCPGISLYPMFRLFSIFFFSSFLCGFFHSFFLSFLSSFLCCLFPSLLHPLFHLIFFRDSFPFLHFIFPSFAPSPLDSLLMPSLCLPSYLSFFHLLFRLSIRPFLALRIISPVM